VSYLQYLLVAASCVWRLFADGATLQGAVLVCGDWSLGRFDHWIRDRILHEQCVQVANWCRIFSFNNSSCIGVSCQLNWCTVLLLYIYCSPVQDVADACRTGAATNVIFGLALGYKSVIIPIFAIAVSIYVSFTIAAMYGIAMSALGMLSTIATGLSIDAYGPISDNAGGIAEMAGMSHRIRERTDALDAAGNTTAAIGKGFAIGSAALVSLALFGAFVSRAGVKAVDVLSPKVIIGLVVGAMLPYWFSAMTMKSVGSAALEMVEEVRRQFNTIPGLMEGTGKPDYANCVKISTDASIKQMIPPGALVMLTPLVVGTLFGVHTLAGVLAGALVSGVQVAISASNTGGAWDNAKKYIEAGASEHARMLGPKGSDCHKAAVIGDTIGDPLKDTSGPSLNILIKLMAVESLVFAPFFATHGGILFKLF
jgi:H+-translocating diphosphatase